jgi:hypothetical protein
LKSFVNAVLLLDERSHRYNIKIKMADKSFSSAHLLYHWVKFYLKDSEKNNESEESNECKLIRKMIVVFILNWNLFEEVKTYHNALQLRNK